MILFIIIGIERFALLDTYLMDIPSDQTIFSFPFKKKKNSSDYCSYLSQQS